MDRFNEVLENNPLVNYSNKWDIVNLLKQTVSNGENSNICKNIFRIYKK